MAEAKKYKKDKALVDESKRYSIDEALDILTKFEKRKFDQTVEVAIRLGVDTKQGDQQIRGALSLPYGLGKDVKVLVFAKGEKQKEAETAGADFVGAEELAEKVLSGWTGFDRAIATPDMMGLVGKLGKVLGPRGLMPNPKVGTVTMDLAKAVADNKAGKVEYRTDKAGVVHAGIGKISFGKEKLRGNLKALIDAINKAKPSASKGTYLKSITLSGTMTPGVKINVTDIAGV